MKVFSLVSLSLLLSLIACQSDKKSVDNPTTESSNEPQLFTLLTTEKTHVDFQNIINEGLNTNVLMYEYFYNGGGVAVGDVNNDGLDDIYFTSNMQSNRLYLNKGSMVFEDITIAAGVAGREGPWKTGTTMADVNGDGLLDIYVCYSGNLLPEKRTNQLFINQGKNTNGIPTFIEKAHDYGLDSPATSTQAGFFDYDKDGDLDMFLLNHNPKSLPVLDEATTAAILKKEDFENGMRFFRHDKGKNGEPIFKDITRQAGLLSSALSYGLGIAIADYNNDGWQDMYISNDYTIPDFLYISDKKGGFTNQISEGMGHFSHFSMGSDAADINNDAMTDIFTLDMLPEDNRRQKLLMAPDNFEKFDFNVKVGFGHQYMRNMLQLNQGVLNTNSVSKYPQFSEIGQLSGISNTDWSWSALFADYDNDGWKDLYITNGYLRDYTNMDFLKYMSDYVQNNQANIQRQNVLDLVLKIPSSNLTNYMYKNGQNLQFKNVVSSWGMSHNANSNGAAYSDLDNDGDLDLVVNNINQPAFIYQNDADKLVKNHYLKIKLNGERLNKLGLGAKVSLYKDGKVQYLEQMPTRGYQSSVSPVLHFGSGNQTTIDSVKIVWLSGKQQILTNVATDKLLVLEEKDAKSTNRSIQSSAPIFKETNTGIKYIAAGNNINDFKRQTLLINPLSFSSPCMAKADVNGDGLEDIFIGGGSGQPGALHIQGKSGSFTTKTQSAFETDKQSEDADAIFFDANGDTFADLYVASGGYGNMMPNDPLLQDRLYLNDGNGNFTKANNALPRMLVSKGCVRVTDINLDGKPDLFVGGRVIPGSYPETPQSYILINQSSGAIARFIDQTDNIGSAVKNIGMVTDAMWYDLNNDKKAELIVVGDWMPIQVFSLDNKKLINVTTTYFEKQYAGLWNKLLLEDFNNDGKMDLLVGNLGVNSQLKATEKEPAELFFKDFDDNGSIDPILCFYIQGKSFPYVTRDELLDQLSIMRTRFPDYKSYADASMTEIFTTEELVEVKKLTINTLKTTLFICDSKGKFQEKRLPLEAQFSPVFAMSSIDVNTDGKKDLVLAGNINRGRLRFGKYDANFGLVLKGDGTGNFTSVNQQQSGLNLKGDIRSMLFVNNILFFGINQQALKAYSFSN
ncbi:VCBS repeat-containing protein [Emticicia sp. BO119]|uniref:VCBS repeat-containing protein n=1 Tax=Emticicia sp. BO119 TaxID=2757768 RepID=UPI0015F08518|nr:VCBS repeat-containing protein [Emticicia sp. BO119]MBA4849655.1 VCBS repeat-containing protein [Emticicia sp. BO119]